MKLKLARQFACFAYLLVAALLMFIVLFLQTKNTHLNIKNIVKLSIKKTIPASRKVPKRNPTTSLTRFDASSQDIKTNAPMPPSKPQNQPMPPSKRQNQPMAPSQRQKLKNGLISRMKDSSRRGLKITFADTKQPNAKRLSFTYQNLTIPPKIENLKPKQANRPFDKYVFVHSAYTEQMSMSFLSILSLCGQAQFGGRKVVRPYIHETSRLVSQKTHQSLDMLFDLKYLDGLLEQSGYSPLIDRQEYDGACKTSDPNHATIHFLYIGETTARWSRGTLKMSKEYYNSIFEKTKVNGWTNCSFLDKHMGRAPSSKQFCINPTIIKDWRVLERDIIGGVKCLNIFLWRGVGGGKYRSYFTEENLKFPHTAIQFAVKLSAPIQNEVSKFRKSSLQDRYIALYVRAELILIPSRWNFNYLNKCLDVLVEVVDAIKVVSGISQVYIASDMSEHGSKSLVRYVQNAKLPSNIFPAILASLAARVGGVVYNNNATTSEISDRTAIALVDLTLIMHAQYLITAGKVSVSSFLRWVIGTFLANRRDDKELWSKVSVCNE